MNKDQEGAIHFQFNPFNLKNQDNSLVNKYLKGSMAGMLFLNHLKKELYDTFKKERNDSRKK